MPFTENFAEFLNVSEFASAGTWSVGPTPINLIFDSGYEATQLGLIAGIEGARLTAMVETASVPTIAHGQTIAIGALNYVVRGVEPDGTGMTILLLENGGPDAGVLDMIYWTQAETFGASPSADAATNTAAIQAALNVGGLVTISTPGKYYVDPDILKAIKPGMLRGAGPNNGGYCNDSTAAGNLGAQAAGVTLATTSRTGWILGIDISGFGVEGIHFQNESAVNGAGIATAGGGIRLGSLFATTGITSSQANGTQIRHCSFYGCYVGIDLYSCDSYSITNNTIMNFVSSAIQINNCYNPNSATPWDGGDPIIGGNQIVGGIFSSNATGLHFKAGGGVRFVGNKINGNGNADSSYNLRYGLWYEPTTGTATSVFPVVGNSIENIDECAVFIDCGGTNGNVSQFTISGNEFNMATLAVSGLSQSYVLRGKAGVQVPFGIYFGQNVVNGCSTLVYSDYFSGSIGKNVVTQTDVGNPIIDVQNGPELSYDVSELVLLNRKANQIIVSDNTANPSNYKANSKRTVKKQGLTRDFPAATISSASLLFKLHQAISSGNCANLIELYFDGYLSGPGAYSCGVKRIVYGNGSSVAAVLTPTGWTDYTHAPNATSATFQYLTWSFTNSSGVLSILATPTSGGTPALNNSDGGFTGVVSGTVTMKISGILQKVEIA